MTQVTIPSEVPKHSFTVGGSPQSVFTFDFVYFDSTDVLVYDDGVLVDANDYTVTPTVSHDNGYDGGDVTLDVAVTNTTIVVSRAVPVSRTSNFALSGSFAIQALNTQLSRLVAMVQDLDPDLQKRVAYSIGVTDDVGEISEVAAARVGKLIGFDDTGKVQLKTATDIPLAVVSAFILTLIDDVDAAAARGTLGAGATGDLLFQAASAGAALATLGASANPCTTIDDMILATTSGVQSRLGASLMSLSGHRYGGICTTAADADHDITVSAFTLRSSDNAAMLYRTGSITKQIDATWAAGGSAGGRAAGVSLSNATWYHLFALGGSPHLAGDVGFDTSITAANLMADAAVIAAGYTKYRRIGSRLTDGSANIKLLTQVGANFVWDANITDFSANQAANTLTAVSVPLGVRCKWRGFLGSSDVTSGYGHVGARDGIATMPTLGIGATLAISNVAGDAYPHSGYAEFITNTSSQIKAGNTGTSTSTIVVTTGFEDFLED